MNSYQAKSKKIKKKDTARSTSKKKIKISNIAVASRRVSTGMSTSKRLDVVNNDFFSTYIDEIEVDEDKADSVASHALRRSSIGHLSRGYFEAAIDAQGKEKELSFMGVLSLDVIISAYTFKWVSYYQQSDGDRLKEKIFSDMGQIALVSALMLTIWVAILFQLYSGIPDIDGDAVEAWKTKLLVVLLWSASVLQCLSMVNAVFLSMIFGVCGTADQVEDLHRCIPNSSRVPLLQFYVAVVIGCMAMVWYVFIFYTISVGLIAGAIMFLFAFTLNAVVYQYNVAALQKVITATQSKKPLVLSTNEIKKHLQDYVKEVGKELIAPDEFLYKLSVVKSDQRPLAHVTKCRAESMFKGYVGHILDLHRLPGIEAGSSK